LQIFHLLKYDCWPRYLRANVGAVEEYSSGTERGHSIASSSGGGRGAVEQLRQFQVGQLPLHFHQGVPSPQLEFHYRVLSTLISAD
jgi:hypothetical protein